MLLENRGDIDVTFALLKHQSNFGPKFSFTPNNGTLRTGESRAIEVGFESDVMGEFFEEFLWSLKVCDIFSVHFVLWRSVFENGG